MFTGIIEETGKVSAFRASSAGWRLEIAARTVCEGTSVGDSIAVDGCCLTVAERISEGLAFDVLEETRRLTRFDGLRSGSIVNLERSLRADARMGGHFVTGHIDGMGTVEQFEQRGQVDLLDVRSDIKKIDLTPSADRLLRIAGPAGCGRLMVLKGSIAVNGVSLTIAECEGDHFSVWLIPHTLEVTNLGSLRVGEAVNLEFDLIGKHVERLLSCVRR